MDQQLHHRAHRHLGARGQAEDPAQLVGQGQLVGGQVPVPAPDLGDPLGHGELVLAGPQQLLGPPLLGDVPAQGHPTADDTGGVGQGHEGDRPQPPRVLVAVHLELGAQPAEGGPGTGLDRLGLARSGDPRQLPAHEILCRPAMAAQAAAGRGPHHQLGIEGHDDHVGQLVGEELEAGLARWHLAGGLSGHVAPSPPAPIKSDNKPQPRTGRDHEEPLALPVERDRHNTAVSTTRSPSANRAGRSGCRSKVRQPPRVTSSATARPAAGACITP